MGSALHDCFRGHPVCFSAFPLKTSTQHKLLGGREVYLNLCTDKQCAPTGRFSSALFRGHPVRFMQYF